MVAAPSMKPLMAHSRRIRVHPRHPRFPPLGLSGAQSDTAISNGKAAAAAPNIKPLITLVYADRDDGTPGFSDKIITS